MFSIGEALYNLFGVGPAGMLIALALIFLIDAVIFPTLPELFTVLIFWYNPTPAWGILMMLVISAVEIVGLTTIYTIVKRVRVPSWIERRMKQYSGMLISPDEKIIFINRFAPVLPFVGAFVAVNDWSLRKSIYYTLIGSWIKYGLIILMSQTFYILFSRGIAEKATIVLILAVIGISLLLSHLRKKRMERREMGVIGNVIEEGKK